MKNCKLSRRIIWSAVFWIATGHFLCISSAFVHDSRVIKASKNEVCKVGSCTRSRITNPTQLFLKNEDNMPMTNKLHGDNTNSFGSTSTRIYMVGPTLDAEESGLLSESVSASPGSGSRMPSLAHGILCPETVSKMERATKGGRNNRAVKAFLDRYHKHGPMSCMELLSDPEILPHLTTAMRDIL